MTKDEALELALEALLKTQNEGFNLPGSAIREAITAIKEALAQPKKLDQDEVDIRSRLYQRIHELETQLAQPEQTNTRPYYTIDELNAWADEKEKQAWRNAAIRIGEELSSVGPDGYYDMDAWKWLNWAMEQEPRGKNSLAQPEQEPVAWQVMVENEAIKEFSIKDMAHDWCAHQKLSGFSYTYWIRPLYTTPPQRKPLTDEQIDQIADEFIVDYRIPAGSHYDFAQAIEAAHGIKE